MTGSELDGRRRGGQRSSRLRGGARLVPDKLRGVEGPRWLAQGNDDVRRHGRDGGR